MSLLEKTEQFMTGAFREADNTVEIPHHQRTVYWIKKLKPDANEALLLAGMTHDIERAFYGDWKAGSSDSGKLKKHQQLSAQETAKFLQKQKAPAELIEQVKDLIGHHEEGGTEDQNTLCDADCLAYFEEKALRNAKKYRREGRVSEIKALLQQVFARIHTPQAQKIARPWYDRALVELSKD